MSDELAPPILFPYMSLNIKMSEADGKSLPISEVVAWGFGLAEGRQASCSAQRLNSLTS